ncbi:hypothetical protein [Nevskia sp.]|uniref:hypothetical protein n=1 Tax=Nevskia sp. TaxID=1929292 RepID=UPI0025F58D47|nr:hypothetical protein [Nevskia sp.]
MVNIAKQRLIRRRVEVLRHELDQRLQTRALTSYSTLTEYASAELRAGRGGLALIEVPLRSLEELGTFIASETHDWPGRVWDQVRADLKPQHSAETSRAILNGLLDEFAWPAGAQPFTLNHLDKTRITTALTRHAERLGQRDSDGWNSLIRRADQLLGLAEVSIRNTAVAAREKAAIAIEEFLQNGAEERSMAAAMNANAEAAPSGSKVLDKHARSSSKGGKNRAEKSPKNAAKILVRQRFDARKPKLWHHGDLAAFAKDMLVDFPVLTSTKVVEGWVRQWRNDDLKSQSSA